MPRTRTRVTSSPRALTRPARARARARLASPATASTAKVSISGVNWSGYKTILCAAYWQRIGIKKVHMGNKNARDIVLYHNSTPRVLYVHVQRLRMDISRFMALYKCSYYYYYYYDRCS